MSQRIAVYSGTFDPITLGHLDVISRAARLCDILIVAVARAHHKTTLFALEQRLAQVQEACTAAAGNECHLRVLPFEGLMVDFCAAQGATVLIKGLRNAADFDYEAPMAQMNEKMAPAIQTVFVLPTPSVQCISSTLVREISSLGGNVSTMVPPGVLRALGEWSDARQAQARSCTTRTA